MSISEAIIIFKAPDDIVDFIERGLHNSGVRIAKRELETGELKFLIPSTYWALSVVLTLLDAYDTKINGKIVSPGGREFEITETGLSAFRSSLIEVMTEQREITLPSYPASEPSFWILYKDEVGQLITNLPKWIDNWSISAASIKSKVIYGIFMLLLATLFVVTWLTLENRISGEALVFLAGTIIGYIFAFMQKYLGITQTAS